MKTKLFAAALTVLTLGVSLPAAAQTYDRGYHETTARNHDRDDRWRRADITVRVDGRTLRVDRDDRLFRRLVSRPYNFLPGLTYQYTDRCNRNGCVVFVFDGMRRRPIDRIFAPHLPNRHSAWRNDDRFDRDYRSYGRYNRDTSWYDDWRRDVDRDDARRGR